MYFPLHVWAFTRKLLAPYPLVKELKNTFLLGQDPIKSNCLGEIGEEQKEKRTKNVQMFHVEHCC